MGQYAKRLHRKMASKAVNLPTEEPKRRPGELLPGGIKDIPTLIKEGHDPIHAVYIFMQNFTSHFAEGVSQLPEMKTWARAVEKAEDEYMPSGPPMSPLTGSFFWMWALYDLRIGKSTDTLAYCQIAANDIIQMNRHSHHSLDHGRIPVPICGGVKILDHWIQYLTQHRSKIVLVSVGPLVPSVLQKFGGITIIDPPHSN